MTFVRRSKALEVELNPRRIDFRYNGRLYTVSFAVSVPYGVTFMAWKTKQVEEQEASGIYR